MEKVRIAGWQGAGLFKIPIFQYSRHSILRVFQSLLLLAVRLKVRNRHVDLRDVAINHADGHIDVNRFRSAVDDVAGQNRSLVELNQRIDIGHVVFESGAHGHTRNIKGNDFSSSACIGPGQTPKERFVAMIAAIAGGPVPCGALVAPEKQKPMLLQSIPERL